MDGLTGGCLCGGVRYAVRGEGINHRICHCRLCQKAIGAAFNARVLARIDDVSVDGACAWFASSEDLERGFCPRCGCTLFSRRASAGVMGMTAGSLDDPTRFRPDMHIWVSSRPPWVVISDGLPQHPGALPSRGY